MAKLTLADLKRIKERVIAEDVLKEGGNTVKVTVHGGTCGMASGAGQVMEALEEEIKASGREDIKVTTSGCIGLCSQEPIVTVARINEEQIRYNFVDDKKMRQIYKEHILEGNISPKLAMGKGSEHST